MIKILNSDVVHLKIVANKKYVVEYKNELGVKGFYFFVKS